MPTNTSFSSINEQLDFTPTSAITIDDALVRALSGQTAAIPSKSPISFLDLSGKVGVGPINGSLSASANSYFPVVANTKLTFVTDVYQANVVWSSTTTSGHDAVLASNGASCTLSLAKNTAGSYSSNTLVTADLYYGGTHIGSNSVSVQLNAEVFNSNLSIVSNTGSFAAVSAGYTAQAASLTLTASSNVVGGTISWSVTPMNSGVTLSGNSVILTSTASSAGQSNVQSYTATATVSLDSTVIGSNAALANLTATMYSSTFVFGVPANSAIATNSGPLILSGTFTASANDPGSVIDWSVAPVSGTPATINTASDGLSANVYLVVSSSNADFGAANSVSTVTAKLYSDSSKTTLLDTKSANLSLTGLVYGLNYTPAANASNSTYTPTTSSTQASATYKAGTFLWNTSIISGSPSITSYAGGANSFTATATIQVQANTVGSNNAVVSIYPSIGYGALQVTRPSQNVSVSATMLSLSGITIQGPSTNTQYSNSGPLVASASLSLSSSVPSGVNAFWSLNNLSGSAANLNVATGNASANVSLTIPSGTFSFMSSVSNVVVDFRDASSNAVLATTSKNVTLRSGTYGLTVTSTAVSNTQSGYSSQTASSSASITLQAGAYKWAFGNTSGNAPAVAYANASLSSTITWSVTTTSSGSNNVTEWYQLQVLDPDSLVQVYTTDLASVSLSAQQNAYSFVLPSSTTNTQILNSSASALSLSSGPTCNISGYSISGWATSNTATGYSFSSNSTSANVGFSMTLSGSVPIAYYTTTVSGTLLDTASRPVRTFSYPVVLRSYYPNPVVSSSNGSALAYNSAQTASGSYTITINSGANTLVATSSVTGSTTSQSNTANSTSWSGYYSVSVGASYASASANVSVQPIIGFYEASSSNTSWSRVVSLSAANYNPALVLATANASVAGFVAPQTANATIVASCNSSIPSPSYRWGNLVTQSGSITASATSGTGNNTFVLSNQQTGVGTASGVARVSDCVLVSGGIDIVHSGPTPNASSIATVYNPALVVSGPTSNNQSNLFNSTSTIVLNASANSSIPSSSMSCVVTKASGDTANVTIAAGNAQCTIVLAAAHQSLSSSYNVTFGVLSSGTLIASNTQALSLSANGTVPSYALTTPANTSSAGFNFAQTASSTCSVSGLTAYGDYAVWTMNTVSGTSPSWSTPGGANGSITTTLNQGSVGSVSGVVNQTCKVYDPDGGLMQTLTSGNYSLSAMVYNPALSLHASSSNNSGTGTVTANGSVTVSSNSFGGSILFTWDDISGSATTTIASGNTSGTVTVTATSGTTNTATYQANVSAVLNGQTIAGPLTAEVSPRATSAAPLSVTVTSPPLSRTTTKTVFSGGSYTVTTPQPMSASGSGGSGSYSYTWLVQTGSSLIHATASGSANTYWNANLTVGSASGSSNSVSANVICQVSDGTSTANSDPIPVTLTVSNGVPPN